ncbi:response regulator transcription factor [Paenibacillus thalictri]|uniref:Response regulator transcription factor n=1 Tax=Paenibacillus thalictri TaxID=2527873 RepID=A0A4Q9DJD8_9BACL|nr:response regulator [Paenibacillus thalictri]TBL74507.1 response regulator transcription factor [Paenibacillus thalictri]
MANILLAEDEAVLRMLITDSLEDEGYMLDAACDGEEALGKIESNDYDLLILDYMMPKLTGLELVKKIRVMPGKSGLKILMLSAKSQQSDRSNVLSAGADEFMSKPFSPLELVRKVGEMLDA